MEYCPKTLKDVLSPPNHPLDPPLAWSIFRQLLEGLAHIHSQKIIHRDLNPNNIFFDPQDNVKIGDFGLAKFSNLDATSAPVVVPEFHEGQSPWAVQGDVPADGESLSTASGQVGTVFYQAPEIEQGWPHIDEKVDIYSLGVVLFELWHPFSTGMERIAVLSDLKRSRTVPPEWAEKHPQVAQLVLWLVGPTAPQRPSALEVLKSPFLPPQMEDEALDNIVRTLKSGENPAVQERILATIFHPERSPEQGLNSSGLPLHDEVAAPSLTGTRERVLRLVQGVLERHGAVQSESSTLELVDLCSPGDHRASTKVVDESGHVLHLRHSARLSLARWLGANQISSLRRYELSRVYRNPVGRSPPREYFQAELDLIGGDHILSVAEAIKICWEIFPESSPLRLSEVRLNHRKLLSQVWAWAGVPTHLSNKVAQLLSVLWSSPPSSPWRRSWWPLVRSQLHQEILLGRSTVDRLHSVESRWAGQAPEALHRLRCGLPPSPGTSTALQELTTLLELLSFWNFPPGVLTLDPLMTPTQDLGSGIFFQVFVEKTPSTGALPPVCIAIGGGFDKLLGRYWPAQTTTAKPSSVGLTLGLEKLISLMSSERSDDSTEKQILVCSRGGGGLLKERMELTGKLWQAGLKAQFVPFVSPSLTEQYEFAHERGIKTLVIISAPELESSASVKVRHLDNRSEKDVPSEEIVKYFLEYPQFLSSHSSTTSNMVGSGKRKTTRSGGVP